MAGRTGSSLSDRSRWSDVDVHGDDDGLLLVVRSGRPSEREPARPGRRTDGRPPGRRGRRTARRGALDERPAGDEPRSRGARSPGSRAVLDLGLAVGDTAPADRRRARTGSCAARPGARGRCHPRVPRCVEPRDVGGSRRTPARSAGGAWTRRLGLRRRRRGRRSRRAGRTDVLAPARARGRAGGARRRLGSALTAVARARVSTRAPPGWPRHLRRERRGPPALSPAGIPDRGRDVVVRPGVGRPPAA